MKRSNLTVTELLILAVIFLAPLLFSSKLTDYNVAKIFLVKVFSLLALLSWIFKINSRKSITTVDSPLNMPVFLYIGWAFISFAWAKNRFETLEVVILEISLVLLYFVTLNNLSNRRAFLTAVIFSGTFVSIYGILQYFGLDFSSAKVVTLVSSLGNINFAGEYLAMVIPFAIVFAVDSKDKSPRVLYTILTGIMVTHLILSRARGGWLGLLFAIIVIFLIKKKIKFLVFMVFMLTVCTSAIYLLYGKGELSSIGNEITSVMSSSERGVAFRLFAWKTTLGMIKENLLLGVGRGNFKIAFPLYKDPQQWHFTGVHLRTENAHNDYLQITSELGLVGFLIFIWLLIASFKVLRKLLKIDETFSTALLSSMVSFTVIAIFGFPFHTPSTAITFWMILGACGLSWKGAFSTRKVILKKRGLLFSTALLLSLFSGIHAVRVLSSDFHLKKAKNYRERKYHEAVIYECRKAIQLYYPNINARTYLASALLKKNELNEALLELETLIRLLPNDPWVLRTAGNTYVKLGRFDEGIVYLRKAVKLNPAYLNSLGFAYFRNGMMDEAILAFKNAVNTEWADEASYYYLGIIYQERGEEGKAIKMYRKALELSEDYEPAMKRLDELGETLTKRPVSKD